MRWGIENHLGLMLAAAGTGFAALRLLSVGEGSPTTAYGILQEAGATNVLLGTALALVPSLGLYGGINLVAIGSVAPRSRVLIETGVLLLALALLTAPLRGFLAGVLVAVYVITAERWIRQGREGRDPSEVRAERLRSARTLGLASAVMIVMTVWFLPPWWPSERLTYTDSTSEVVYVVHEGSETLVVLDDKRLRRVDTVRVRRRSFCVPKGQTTRLDGTLLQLLHPVRYPRC